MKYLNSLLSASIALVIAGAAHAAAPAQEVARLGKDLTMVGADKAANADGSIPAYHLAPLHWRNTMIQRTLPAFLLALGIGALAGCSSPAVITLNDGREIQAVDTPSYDEDSGFYEFEQLDGKRTRLNKDQVRTVKEL